MKNSKHQGENFKKTLEDEKICHAPSFVALLLKKMMVLSKVVYRFDAIPVKIGRISFTELETIILNFIWRYKRL